MVDVTKTTPRFPSMSVRSRHRTLSSGVVIVRRRNGEPRYLLLRAYNYWDFPKGKVEKGEDPLSGAKREVKEETGLEKLDFRWGLEYRETPPYAHGKVARYYLAEAEQGEVRIAVNPVLGRPEHHEYRWVDYASARRLVADRLVPVLDWANGRINGKSG